jgi:D-amino-acid dehydrogenase
MTAPESPVVVIGAGIVGACCAAYLVRAGVKVLLIDRRGPGEMTSFGNSGGIQDLAATPIGLPGMMRQVPHWLMDKDGPLHIRWRHLPKATPWLLRFAAETRESRALHNAAALNSLNRHCSAALLPLAHWAGADDLIRIPGQLYLYDSKAAFERNTLVQRMRNNTGQPYEIIDAATIRALEPALPPIFEIGIRAPGNGHCRNPHKLAVAIAEAAFRDGAQWLRADVNGFDMADGVIRGVQTDRGTIKADKVVIAAGMWSRQLAGLLGHHVPLESHRGYHVTIRDSGIALNNMLLAIDHKIAITPMETGLRIGGTVEFAGLEALPDYRRAEVLLELGKTLLPGLRTADYTAWMGHRPCTPDSLPVIGLSPRVRNVLFAFGHGHMGLIGSAPTGRTIAELVTGQPPGIDIGPFAVDRF